MASASTTSTTNEEKDVPWTDAQIRWSEDELSNYENINSENETDECNNPFDPFADENPQEVFSFRFVTNEKKSTTATAIEEPIVRTTEYDNNSDGENESIRLEIHGYKTDSDQVWESTGLTLWKASTYLCDYMVQHAEKLRGQRVLELGAGLGLNGVLAHRLSADSVVITDGDSDAMVELRKNIVVNRIQNESDDTVEGDSEQHPQRTVSAAQLIWGLDSANRFLESTASASSSSSLASSQFSIIIASDVIYAAIVIDPLWETVRTLLRKSDGEFWMAFAVRKVPVTIEFVLQKSREYGFRYELVDQQNDGDSVEDDSEAGPVFIYVFRWDTGTEDKDNGVAGIKGS